MNYFDAKYSVREGSARHTKERKRGDDRRRYSSRNRTYDAKSRTDLRDILPSIRRNRSISRSIERNLKRRRLDSPEGYKRHSAGPDHSSYNYERHLERSISPDLKEQEEFRHESAYYKREPSPFNERASNRGGHYSPTVSIVSSRRDENIQDYDHLSLEVKTVPPWHNENHSYPDYINTSHAPQTAMEVSLKGLDAIPMFDGTNPEIGGKQFLTLIDRIAEVNKWPAKERKYILEAKLTGGAKNWFLQHCHSLNIKLARKRFSREYQSNADFCENIKSMLRRRKSNKESLSAYFTRKMILINSCFISGRKAVSCLLDGMDDVSLKGRAYIRDFASPELLYEFLVKEETSHQTSPNKIDSAKTNSGTNAKETPKPPDVKHFVDVCINGLPFQGFNDLRAKEVTLTVAQAIKSKIYHDGKKRAIIGPSGKVIESLGSAEVRVKVDNAAIVLNICVVQSKYQDVSVVIGKSFRYHHDVAYYADSTGPRFQPKNHPAAATSTASNRNELQSTPFSTREATPYENYADEELRPAYVESASYTYSDQQPKIDSEKVAASDKTIQNNLQRNDGHTSSEQLINERQQTNDVQVGAIIHNDCIQTNIVKESAMTLDSQETNGVQKEETTFANCIVEQSNCVKERITTYYDRLQGSDVDQKSTTPDSQQININQKFTGSSKAVNKNEERGNITFKPKKIYITFPDGTRKKMDVNTEIYSGLLTPVSNALKIDEVYKCSWYHH